MTLPIAEPSPLVRLHQVSYSFQADKETGRAVAANRLAGIAGFAPTTFHAVGARVAAAEARREFQIVITNVRVRSHPCSPPAPAWSAPTRSPPLLTGQALAIGVTSVRTERCSTASRPTATWSPTPTSWARRSPRR